jgi:hypothetical protein
MRLLVITLLVVAGLTFICIILPLSQKSSRVELAGSFPWLAFFAAIGLGFMFIEMASIQRMTLFLGHPVYGLTVILFTLLLGAGIGSYFSHSKDSGAAPNARDAIRLMILLILLGVYGAILPPLLVALRDQTNLARIAFAFASLFPLGLFMGMPFPIGFKTVREHFSGLAPWFWATNGATSVCATVISVAISMFYGISFCFWVGVGCYVIATVVFLRQIRVYKTYSALPAPKPC